MAGRSMSLSERQLDAPPPYSVTDPAANGPAVTTELGRPPQYGSVVAARPAYQPYGIAPAQRSQSYNTTTPPVVTQPLLASRQV